MLLLTISCNIVLLPLLCPKGIFEEAKRNDLDTKTFTQWCFLEPEVLRKPEEFGIYVISKVLS